jgi:hypothetical protein
MATLVNVQGDSLLGSEVLEAIEQIRQGLAVLKKYDGMRAELLAVSATKFGEHFGITDATEAQAMSDRWSALTAGNYTGLADFMNATVEDIPAT